ncbi:hypothetical protein HU720_07410 [Pseudomonas sp. SWRI51]|uniref:DUF6392 family protein n=1 Tax=Pseudomonas sp. SWRI51 TaxID=2745491 RepID=UPI0016461879|nr:DUF6392 family protein [Pseudomonas sp. SWRI51]MBC3411128.1 hypothetical protein [Pseudomonas sp. SWRI51]
MNIELNAYLEHLGKTHVELIEHGVLDDSRLIEVYPGSLTLYRQPQAGLDLAFLAETKQLESVMYTLRKLVPEDVLFTGNLPEPYASCKKLDDVRDRFGAPHVSKGPLRLPDPLGEVGGWDGYTMTCEGREHLRVVFKYDADLTVFCISFGLKQ